MLNLYTLATSSEAGKSDVTNKEKFSLLYHNFFDYPLNLAELIRWLPAENVVLLNRDPLIAAKNGYYCLEERDGLIYKRLLRKRLSTKKLEIAKKAARVLAFIPGVQMVAVTGSLAMGNSTDDSDIDLMLITKAGKLWTTRLLVYFSLFAFRFSLRSPKDKQQKDKLCLNMWLDENNLVWLAKDRNLYTAHETAQVVPLVNKNKTYEKFLYKNKWILNFWPNAVKISNVEYGRWNEKSKFNILNSTFLLVEKISFLLQYRHMKSKITREVVTPTRALFHPQDWGKVILTRLSS